MWICEPAWGKYIHNKQLHGTVEVLLLQLLSQSVLLLQSPAQSSFAGIGMGLPLFNIFTNDLKGNIK